MTPLGFIEASLHRIRRTAGIKHPAERALAATKALPLREALARLRNATAGMSPPVPGGRRFLRDVLRVPDEDEWAASAAWSWAAAWALTERLLDGRRAEVLELIEPIDMARIEAELGHKQGVLFTGAHVGMPFATRLAIAERLPALTALVSERSTWFGGEEIDTRDTHGRQTSLVSTATLLRGGGAVYAAVDGRRTSARVDVTVLGKRVSVGRGVPAVARMSRARSVPAAALWTDDLRIRIVLGPSLPQAAPGAKEPWEHEWLAAWARWYESIVRAQPRSLRMTGGLWTREGLLR